MQRRLLSLLLFATSCANVDEIVSPESAPAQRASLSDDSAQEGAAAEEDRDAARRELLELIRADRLEDAHATLETLLVARFGDEARAAFASGQPEDGLLLVDRALSLAPDHDASLLLKAEGSLALAEKKIAEAGSAGLIEGALEDAREYYQRCAPTPRALLGASRTAILQGNADEALGWAERAMEQIPDEDTADALPFRPERVLAEASFRAYTSAKGAEDETAPTLFLKAEDALGRLLGRASDDPWAWGTLADLNEWDARYAEASAVLERGLARMPEEASLYERLARVSRKAGGSDAVVATFANYTERHPDAALARWYGARERFDAATVDLMAGFSAEDDGAQGAEDGDTSDPSAADATPDGALTDHALTGDTPTGEAAPADDAPAAPLAGDALREAFRIAEEQFRRTREDEPDFADACRGYEVMCRNAIGWSHYQAGELAESEAAFLSTGDVVDRGMEWKIEGRLLSAVDGLHLVGTRYNDREDWASSARVYGKLHAYQPENDVWANNTGFFCRDAAVELELQGKRLCRAANGEPLNDTERAALGVAADAGADALRALANERFARARDLMQTSWDGYREAARLAPDDVRIVNDAGLVLVYYLHENLEEAERLLLQSVAAGTAAREDESLTEDALWELENAWGDAHQNLGVLYAIHKNDPATAIEWFEKAEQIGPEPRPLLTNFFLPFLRGELDPEIEDVELYSMREWAAPCN